MTSYIVAGTRPWNKAIFAKRISMYSGDWWYIETLADLQEHLALNPRYIFFLHWSDIVPSEIVAAYECVCFHPSDLPKGRGGSPIQNLIWRDDEKATKLTAFRMTDELDAGPIYLQRPLDLSGSAEDIFEREMLLASEMIWRIVTDEIQPKPQRGEPTYFKRRKPEQSKLPSWGTAEEIYDFIRMLDADTYPRAFVELDGYYIEFSNAQLLEDKVVATATFLETDDD
jgi:methionyl-tRNA formyltransferase